MAVNDAIHGLFANETIRNLLVRTRYLLFLVLLLPLAWFFRPSWLLPGIAVSMFGQLIQTWCFATLIKNRELTVRGPYLLCRNPMYVGRYFLILGFVMLTGSWIVALAYTVLYCAYMVSRVRREETRLRRVFGDDYATYCSKVNRFVPSLRGVGSGKLWTFDVAPFLENNAHWNIVLTLVAFAAVYAVWRWVIPA